MQNLTYEQSLVFAAKNGNERSFEELYRLYYQKVYALALAAVKNAADAEDAVQMTFISAWQNLRSLEDLSAFNTWLQRICRNNCYTLLRNRRNDVSTDDLTDEEFVFDVAAELKSDMMLPQLYAERADLRARLGRIIDELSSVQRQTLTLHYFSGLSVEEIARVMDVSEGTVKSRLFLARRAIRTEIEEEERKTGQKFYGVAWPLVPFAVCYLQKVQAAGLSEAAAASLFRRITDALAAAVRNAAAGTVGAAGYPAAAQGYPAAAVRAYPAAGAGYGAAPAGAASHVPVRAAGAVLKTTAKRAAGGLLTRVVAGAAAASLMLGGSIGTVAQVSAVPSFPAVQTARPAEPKDAGADTLSAYGAYLDHLIDCRDSIDAYRWQKGIPDVSGSTDSSLTRSVVLTDITGDTVPELIYVEGTASSYGADDSAQLVIAGCRNGYLKILYTGLLDPRDNAFRTYYLFQEKGDPALHLYLKQSGSGEGPFHYEVLRFAPENGALRPEKLCAHGSFAQSEDAPQTDAAASVVRGSPASEAECQETVRRCEQNLSAVLMISRECEPAAFSFTERNGCPAMSCEEAITWLRGLVEARASADDPELIDVDTLPISLTAFLTQLEAGMLGVSGVVGKTAYCYDAADAAGCDINILSSMMGEPPCVQYSIYPGVLPEVNWNAPDPRGWGSAYAAYDGETAAWIARNIFNVSDADFTSLELRGEAANSFYREDTGADSWRYYTPVYGIGDPFRYPVLTSASFDGQKYHICYDSYFMMDGDDPTVDGEYVSSYSAVLEYKMIDGKAYWSLYHHEIDEDRSASMRTWPDWQSAYRDFVLNQRFLSSGDPYRGYGDLYDGIAVVNFALLDLNEDDTPELLIFNGFNGRDLRQNYVFTFADGTVHYCGNTLAEAYSVAGYPGLFSAVMASGFYLDDEYRDQYSEISYLDYSVLRGLAVETERVSITGTRIDSGESEELFRTDDSALYKASKKPALAYRVMTLREIESKGWNAFLTCYRRTPDPSANEVRRKTVKFDGNRQLELDWGWNLFRKDASEYDHSIALAGLVLSNAAEMSQTEAENRLKSLGFGNCKSVYYGGNEKNMEMPAATFASQLISMNEQYTVIAAVVVRGSSDAGDWLSDAHAQFDGFYPAAKNVRDAFLSYYRNLSEYYGVQLNNDNTILLITGHSYGGAVAGQLAQMLKGTCAWQSAIFDYTFASPNYQTFQYDRESFTNVHNIINKPDIVPDVPFGYKRYGHDWYYDSQKYSIGGNHVLSTYLDCMLEKLPENMGPGATMPLVRWSIHCPVDVQVLSPDGTLMAWTSGETAGMTEAAQVLVQTDGDAKYIYVPEGVAFTIRLTGTGRGTMRCEQEVIDSRTQTVLDRQSFDAVPLEKGLVYASDLRSGASGTVRLYQLDQDGHTRNKVAADGTLSKARFASDALGWISAACAVLGAISLVVDLISLLRWARKRKRQAVSF